MYKYTFISKDSTLVLTTAPINWNNLQYTLTRDEHYHGVFVGFTAQLQFIREGKDFIDAVYEKYGFNSQIDVNIDVWNPKLVSYVPFVQGTMNFNNISQKDVDGSYVTEIDIIAGLFEQKFMNRDSVPIDYQQLVTIDGSAIIPNAVEVESIILNGILPPSSCYAVYPFELFERLITSICNQSQSFESSIFGKTINGYSEDGQYAYMMIFVGIWARNYLTTEATVSIDFKNLFDSLNAIFNLGLSIETIDNKKVVLIEKKSFFYQQDIILTIGGPDDTANLKLKDLEFTFDPTLIFNEINAGYTKAANNDNLVGSSEYNNESDYTMPIVPIANKLSILSKIRADGTGIEKLRSAARPLNTIDTKQDQLDKELFIVSCINNNGTITSRQQEGYTKIEGIYGNSPLIYCNLDITPARNVLNWSEIINITLQKNKNQNLIIQKSTQVSHPVTRMNGESIDTADGVDIPNSMLNASYLSGILAKFNAPLGLDQITAINQNKHGRIKFWDYIFNKYRSGWIKELSTEPVDKTTNYALMVASDSLSLEDFYYLLAEDGSALLAEDGSLILQENVNQ